MSFSNILVFNTRVSSDSDARVILSESTKDNFKFIEIGSNLNVQKIVKRQSFQSKGGGGRSFFCSLKEKIRNRVKKSEFLMALILLRGINQDKRRINRLFDHYRPKLLIIFDDRFIRPNLVILHQAEQRNIPVLLVPVAQNSLEGADYKIRSDDRTYFLSSSPNRWIKRFLYHFYPMQFYSPGQGQQLCFFKPIEIMVLLICKMLPQNPWIWGGSGFITHCCSLGTNHYNYMIGGGVEPSLVSITGQPSIDTLFKSDNERGALREKLNKDYCLDEKQKLIICAVPQYAEHGLLDWHTHKKLTEELFSILAASDNNILLSLHPKSNISTYKELAVQYNLPILTERISQVLAAADLLIATNSSVVAWAVGASIPAIVIDPLKMDDLYDGFESIIKLDNHEELSQKIRSVLQIEELTRLRAITEIEAPMLGCYDGQNTARIIQQIEKMVD